MIKKISEFIRTTDLIDETHKNKIKVEKLDDILNDIINKKTDDNIYYHFIQNIILIISRIKNINNKNIKGCHFYNEIPKTWKLSDNNIDLLKKFMGEKEFLLHNSIFVRSKDKDEGFYSYQKTPEQRLYFIELFRYIKQYTKNINLIVGKKNNLFNPRFASYLIRFIFIFILKKFVDYIQELSDETSGLSTDTNQLFQALEEQNMANIEESTKQVSSLYMDIILNIIQEYNDPLWINIKLDDLDKKIRQQMEREKQSLIGKLDAMDNDQVFISVQLQTYGISNWFKNASQENETFVNSDEYKNMTDVDRNEVFQNILNNYENEANLVDPDMDIGVGAPIEEGEDSAFDVEDFDDEAGEGYEPIDDNFE